VSCFFNVSSICNLYLQVFVVSQWANSSLCSSSKVLKSLEHLTCIKCTSLLHAKSMLIGWRVLHCSRKVASVIIVDLHLQSAPFDED